MAIGVPLETPGIQISLLVTPEQRQWLSHAAWSRGMSRSELVRIIIARAQADWTDQEQDDDAEQVAAVS
jgi:hypothetical protein